MRELPEGWTSAPVGKLFKIYAGGTPDKSNPAYWGGTVPWLSSGDIKGPRITGSSLTITEAGLKNSSAKMCRAGSILLVVRSGVLKHTLPVSILEIDAAINQDIKCLDSGDDELNRWLALGLRSSASDILTQNREGTTVQSVKTETITSFELAIPPRTEQRRIVSKLDEVLARVSSCRERLDKFPRLLARFRQSILAMAVNGGLTAEWRRRNPSVLQGSLLAALRQAHDDAGGHKRGNAAEPTDEVHNWSPDDLPFGWDLAEMRTIVDPARPVTYGILKPGQHAENGIPYIRVADYPNDQLNLTSIRRTSPEIERSFSRARLLAGDILLSIRGTVGRVCVVPPSLTGANITQDTARLSLQGGILSSFVVWVLRSPPVQKRMQGAVKGVAVRGINIGDVRALQIAIPPLQEQEEIVRKIESLFELADRLNARYENAVRQIEKLTQSTLARAFRGDLVGADWLDEKAESFRSETV